MLNVFKSGDVIRGFGDETSPERRETAYLVVSSYLGNMDLLPLWSKNEEEMENPEILHNINNDSRYWDYTHICDMQRLYNTGHPVNATKANEILAGYRDCETEMSISVDTINGNTIVDVQHSDDYNSPTLDMINWVRNNRFNDVGEIFYPSNMTKGIKFNYTDEDSELIKEQAEKISKYGWTLGSYAHKQIMDKNCSSAAKGWLWKAFSEHPNYVGAGCIMMPGKMPRKSDTLAIRNFSDYIDTINWKMLADLTKEEGDDNFPYDQKECELYADKYENMIDIANRLYKGNVPDRYIMSSKERDELFNRRDEWRKKQHSFYSISGIQHHNNKLFYRYKAIEEFSSLIRNNESHIITEELIYTINNTDYLSVLLKDLHIQPSEGMKMTKFVNSFCKKTKIIDKANEMYPSNMVEKNGRMVDTETNRWDKRRVVYGEAITPMDKDVVYFFSVNYLAFLLMSHGDGTTSCHTIDKQNIECRSNNYQGQCAGGTLSYALDPSTVIFKVLPEDTPLDPREALWTPYILRQLMYVGEDKIVHSRLYPQSNDTGSDYLYDYYRNVQQKLISELFNPNSEGWWFKKERVNCISEEISAHYSDWSAFEDNCCVSTMKHGTFKNKLPIHVGNADLICVCCGGTWDGSDSDYQGQIECPECYGNERVEQVQLANGDWVDADDEDIVRCADGEYRYLEETVLIDGERYDEDDDRIYFNDYEDEYFLDDGSSSNHAMECSNSAWTRRAPYWYINNNSRFVFDGAGEEDYFYDTESDRDFCLVETSSGIRLGFEDEDEANSYGYFRIEDEDGNEEWIEEDEYIERMNSLSELVTPDDEVEASA